MYQSAMNSYKQANVTTANPMKLVIMLYEGAISSLKLARKLYVARDYEGKAKALQKCYDIISEINVSLDLEKGGQIARNLRSLYLYMIQRLLRADLNRDMEGFDEVIRMLTELETAWKEIAGSAPQARSASDAVPVEEMKPAQVSQAWTI